MVVVKETRPVPFHAGSGRFLPRDEPANPIAGLSSYTSLI